MKIPFDPCYIPQIESGKVKVETKNGYPVKIISWDAKSAGRDDDIIALVTNSDGTTENVWRYYSDGHLISDSSRKGDKDLCVILPDSPLKPLEDAMRAYVKLIQEPDGHTEDEITFKAAQSIMTIARSIVEYRYPKWRKATCDIESDTIDYLVKFKHDGGDGKDWEEIIPTNRLKMGEWYLELSDTFGNLPKVKE